MSQSSATNLIFFDRFRKPFAETDGLRVVLPQRCDGNFQGLFVQSDRVIVRPLRIKIKLLGVKLGQAWSFLMPNNRAPNNRAKYRRQLLLVRSPIATFAAKRWLAWSSTARSIARPKPYLLKTQVYRGHVELNTSSWNSTNTRDCSCWQRQPTRPSFPSRSPSW